MPHLRPLTLLSQPIFVDTAVYSGVPAADDSSRSRREDCRDDLRTVRIDERDERALYSSGALNIAET